MIVNLWHTVISSQTKCSITRYMHKTSLNNYKTYLMFAFLDSGDIDENPKALKDLYENDCGINIACDV